MKKMILILIILSLSSCASKPQLYPNAKFKSVGKKVAKKDIDRCIVDANEYLEKSKGKKVAKSAGAGAAIGAAVGAVGGLFTGHFGTGLVRGGAMGAGGGAVAGALSPDEIKHRYVNQCLADQGYRVLGWD